MNARTVLSACLHFSGTSYLVGKRFGKKSLTVVNHHRINYPHANEFKGLKALVSATPEMFERQLRYLKSRYTLVTGTDVVAFVRGHQNLPDNACLITFDDGYLDNYQNAAPILAKYNAPAIIFLATSRMYEPFKPMWWDEVAQVIRDSQRRNADIPLLGRQRFHTQAQTDELCKRLTQQMKRHDAIARQEHLKQLTEVLDSSPGDHSSRYFMNWEEVRSLLSQNIEFHAHTVNHPILSQIDEHAAESELLESRRAIETETDQAATLFAYPNGQTDDYTLTTINLLEKLGFDAAFTLNHGPITREEVLDSPFEIRRIYLSHKDAWSKFMVKLDGVPRILERF